MDEEMINVDEALNELSNNITEEDMINVEEALNQSGLSTDTSLESDSTSSTEGQQGYIAPGEEGFVPREGALGAVQDIAEGTIRGLPKNLYEGAAPAIGVIDTAIDTFNLATGFKVPKLPEYEDNVSTAVRNISGLVIPSLGLRSMAISAGTKLQAKLSSFWFCSAT